MNQIQVWRVNNQLRPRAENSKRVYQLMSFTAAVNELLGERPATVKEKRMNLHIAYLN